MKVKVKKISEGAVLPYKKYMPDFCYDVVATSCEEVAPNVYKYGLGLAFQIERDGVEPVVGRKYGNDYGYNCHPVDINPNKIEWK